MPLWRAAEAFDWNGDVVSFPMTDGEMRIIYRVSREALADRASANGRSELPTNLLKMFLVHRTRIELIASVKHDARDPDRLVRTSDLNPRRP